MQANSIAIRPGWQPGALGRIVEMHGLYYAREHGFGPAFESRVAAGLAEFAARLASPRNGLWLALDGAVVVGAVAIDGEDLGDGCAHLRWFVMDDRCRGQGVGRRLLQEALAFCDAQGFSATQLWTFRGLDAARGLYEQVGFTLAHEQPGTTWGTAVMEQHFVRRRPAAAGGAPGCRR
jgi:GNAT superfamily N-acetyltransferase